MLRWDFPRTREVRDLFFEPGGGAQPSRILPIRRAGADTEFGDRGEEPLSRSSKVG